MKPLSREARRRAKNRAAGLCSCGRPKAKGGRCARCYRAHAAYMRAYMTKRRQKKALIP